MSIPANEIESIVRQVIQQLDTTGVSTKATSASPQLAPLTPSAARGDWMPESDIDILVLRDRVSDSDSEWMVNRAVTMGLLESGLLIQPLFMPQSDFVHLRNRERRFAIEVDREGVDL